MNSSANTTTLKAPTVSTKSLSFMKKDWGIYRSLFALITIMFVLAYLTDGTFLSPRNLTNLARQVAINGILAVGMTYVILIGGVDLSVGSIVALAGIVAGLLQVNGGLAEWTGAGAWGGAALTLLAAIGVGTACGVFNAWWITRHRIAPFIITLGMMVIARGLALILAGGAAIAPLGEVFNQLGQSYIPPVVSVALAGAVGLGAILWRLGNYVAMGSTLVLTAVAIWAFQGYRGIPIPVLIFVVLGIGGSLILQKTRLGRFVLAIGGNSNAAWLAGVPIRKITFGIYAVMGALAGLCGATLAARLNGALPTAGELFELDAIAAVVIGGTSLRGGIGTVRGAIIGAFLIGTLNNGMSLLDVAEFYQKVIKGLIIILAVWFDTRSGSGSAKTPS